MTVEGLQQRWNQLRARVRVARHGLPHGCDPHADIERRLTRTPFRVIFDVGANYGQTAAVLRQWYPSARIHCFEPIQATYEVLRARVARWPQVETHRMGLGRVAGPQPMAVSSDACMSQVGESAPASRTELVEFDTVDAICGRLAIDRVDYLKIDTEGHDLAVLEGAGRMLSADAIAVVEVEAGMNRDNTYHASARSLEDHLRGHGYRLFGVYEQTLQWPTADAFLRRANLVFVSPETVRANRWTG